MVDSSQLIDKKIDETFIIKAPKSYTAYSSARKTQTTVAPQARQKQVLTPKLNIKEERSLLIRAAKTRGESQERGRSDLATTQANTTKPQPDQWKAHKRLALLQHPLWVECVKSWWNVMDPHCSSNNELGNEGNITMEQYLDLSVRLQKALNPEFEYENACLSAAEDWQIDADDWNDTVSIGETQHPVTPNSTYSPSEAKTSLKSFDFDKFSEFLFEIGEAWCDGSIESILVVVNCVMLHISQGVHLCSTVFKDIEQIPPLPAKVFSEVADMGLNSAPLEAEFIKWYQRNFLEITSMRKYVTERLFKIEPNESRVNDLWIMEEGYNQTEVLIQCINRLESLLNRIQKANPVKLPLQSERVKNKIQVNFPINDSLSVRKPTTLPPLRPKAPVHSANPNVLVYTRNVKLTLVGQALSGRKASHEVTEAKENESQSQHPNPNPNLGKGIKLPVVTLKSAISQKLATEISAQVSDNDLSYEHLFEELSARRPYSTPLNETKAMRLARSSSCLNLKNDEARKLFEEGLDPEYTPKLQFNKVDIKYHKIDKSWRTGKFLKQELERGSPEVGEVNKKSPMEYFETKKKIGMEMISNYEKSRNSKTQDPASRSKVSPSKFEISDKKESFGTEEIEKLVGLKIAATPKRPGNEEQEKNARTAPVQMRKNEMKVLAEYTFKDFSHLIKPRKPQKLVFKDSLEFLYALNQAKYDFNKSNQSEFLSYSKQSNDYRSRRDELGGYISRDEWKKFIERLEEIIQITKSRRKRRGQRKKRRAKNSKKNGFGRGRLWRNVFIKPFNQESFKRNRYLREVKKLDNSKSILPSYLDDIVNETIKIPAPPPVHLAKPKTRQYSPGRYRVRSSN